MGDEMRNELQDNNIRISMARQLENEIRRRYGHIEDNFENEAILAVDCLLDTSVPSIHPLDELETCIIREKLIPGEKGNNKTLKEISEQLHYLTSEAIRRIYLNAYRKLISRIVFSKIRLKINQFNFTQAEKRHIFTSPNFQLFTDYFHVKGTDLEFYNSIQTKIRQSFYEESMNVQDVITDNENLSIENMGLTMKTFKSLKRKGIMDIRNLIAMHTEDISNIPYLSNTSYMEIMEIMDNAISRGLLQNGKIVDCFDKTVTSTEIGKNVLLKKYRKID